MSEDLKKCNEEFTLKLSEFKSRLSKKELDKLGNLDGALYYFFLAGYQLGSGNSCLIR